MANTTGMVQRQQRELTAVEKVYGILPVGEEVISGSSMLGKQVGISYTQMNVIAQHMEQAGILSRREAWGANGKYTFWKLNLSREDALSAITDFQANELALAEISVSLKGRILAYVKEQGKVTSAMDIYNSIKTPTENLDLHNLTHCLYSLRREGKVSFKVDDKRRNSKRKSNDKIPTNITYAGKVEKAEPAVNSSPEPVNPFLSTEPEAIELPAPTITGFPLITALVNRRITLEAAASLAEQAGEDEMALALLEKAQSNESDFNSEVIALWNLYQECKG